MTEINRTTVILGDEFDESLRVNLFNVLRGLGAFVATSEEHAIAGSQELQELDVLVGSQVLHVEAETYVGLSISGPEELVKQIQRLMNT